MTRHISLCLLAVLASSCSANFDRKQIQERIVDQSLQLNEQEVAEVLKLKPQLKLPCRVAVHLASEKGSATWRWTQRDRDVVEAWGKKLKADKVVSDFFVLTDLFTRGTSLKDLRVTAARHGADALFILRGGAQVDGYVNAASALYITIVGGWLVPGNHRDALFLLEGGLVDVHNGFLYTTAETEGESGIVRPVFLLDDQDNRDVVENAKQKALEDFGKRIVERIRDLEPTTAIGKGEDAKSAPSPLSSNG